MELFETLLVGGIDKIIFPVLGMLGSRTLIKRNYVSLISQEKVLESNKEWCDLHINRPFLGYVDGFLLVV